MAGQFRSDFLVDDKIIVELKAIKSIGDHEEGQLLNYLKGTGYRIGLLLNFSSSSLQYKRKIL